MNYEKDIRIDETALDVEFLEQPRLMLKYTQHQAEASYELDRMKNVLEVKKVEIDKEIRTNPDKFGITKPTEGAIQNAIVLDKRYKDAWTNYLECKYELDMVKGAVRAMEQRKEALENLVRLHGQQYFAGPRVPRNLSEEQEKRQKQIDKRVSNKMKRGQR